MTVRRALTRRDVRVPLSTVTSVDVADEPIRRIQGLKPHNFKVFGGYWPGRLDHPDDAKTALTA